MQQSTFLTRNRQLSPSKLNTLKVIENRYEIKDQCLGKGSYGKVFLCFDKQSNKTIAAKQISKALILQKINNNKDKVKFKQFYINSIRNQADIMQKLDHQNVIKMYGRSETDKSIYFYLEYCNHKSLAQLLNTHKIIEYQAALPIIKKTIKGCHYLHYLNIAHRDLKPQNILFSNGEPKISDFGFAIELYQEEQVATISQFRVGTQFYMAPEVSEMSILTLKSDVWSLGIIFYRMLTGRFPFETMQMSRNKFMFRRELWRLEDKLIPNFIKAIIQKMLQYDYKLRPSLQILSALFNF